MEVTAKLKFVRSSPRKMRLVADMIRGKKVASALDILALTNKKPAEHLLKLLRSAVANADHNHKMVLNTLRVKSITVDGGPVLKRFMPKAHGRATPVREPTAHVNLVLEEIVKK